VSSNPDITYQLSRRAQQGIHESMAQLRRWGVSPSETFTIAMANEIALAELHERRVVLPCHWFYVLQALASTYGPVALAAEIDSLAKVISEEEDRSAGEFNRVGPSLAPFARGLVFLACAFETDGLAKIVEAQRVFGTDGVIHVAGLRQAMTPTQNKQQNYIRTSLAALHSEICPMANEAWRAFFAWAFATPTTAALGDALGIRGPRTNADLVDEIEDLLGHQFWLRPQVPKDRRCLDVFARNPYPKNAERMVFAELIEGALLGRAKPELSPFRMMSVWPSMVGRLTTLEFVEKTIQGLMSTGIPCDIFELGSDPDLVLDLATGIKSIRKSLSGSVEGRLVEKALDAWAPVLAAINASGELSGLGPLLDELKV